MQHIVDTKIKRILLSVLVGFLASFLCYEILSSSHSEGDFYISLRMARDLLMGNDPYSHAVGIDWVSYPLPAAFFALPFSFLPDPFASALFAGLSGGLLAWLLTRDGKLWTTLMLLSWPFIYALFFAQWTPLITCLWFISTMMPLVLIKPQNALPLILTHKPLDVLGIVISAFILMISLVIYPSWPLVWLKQISGYTGLPPIFSLPFGPLIFLALFHWRDKRAWLVVIMALMPQRVVYDQLALMLVASNRHELTFQVAVSWLTLPALLVFGGWINMPGGWQNWIVVTLYLPALLVLLYKDIIRLYKASLV